MRGIAAAVGGAVTVVVTVLDVVVPRSMEDGSEGAFWKGF